MDNLSSNVEGLATLLVLQDQIKKVTNLNEFGYFVTNETHRLLHYNTAYLWKKKEVLGIHLLSQSEVVEIDQQSILNQWVKETIDELQKSQSSKELIAFNFEKNKNEVQSDLILNDQILNQWPDVLPRHILWCPFLDASHTLSGGLLLFRDTAFSEQELKMFRWLAANYEYTWKILTHTQLTSIYQKYRHKITFKVVIAFVLLIMIFPVRMTVVSNATVESNTPALINAPIAGVIHEFLVHPGEHVKAGQLLATLDKNDLIKSVEVAQKKLLLTQARIRSANNEGYEEEKIRNEIPVLEAELAINQSELDYAQAILKKADILSPIDGIAVFDSKEDWVGQPIQVGENMMTIENPNQTQLKISIPVPDLIRIEVGAQGKFYPYGQWTSIPIVLSTLGYSAKMMPNRVLAYQFLAQWSDPTLAPRIGTQGTARIYGRYVPFIYFVLRHPLQLLRESIGF